MGAFRISLSNNDTMEEDTTSRYLLDDTELDWGTQMLKEIQEFMTEHPFLGNSLLFMAIMVLVCSMLCSFFMLFEFFGSVILGAWRWMKGHQGYESMDQEEVPEWLEARQRPKNCRTKA